MAWSSYVAMIVSSDILQKLLIVNMSTAIKFSVNHSRKHVLRL